MILTCFEALSFKRGLHGIKAKLDLTHSSLHAIYGLGLLNAIFSFWTPVENGQGPMSLAL